uniref:putative GTP-binding protein 6 isoform X1 n=1 Tax=Myxine glutinosa TaxID=7769 RepID=UPI00358E4C7C
MWVLKSFRVPRVTSRCFSTAPVRSHDSLLDHHRHPQQAQSGVSVTSLWKRYVAQHGSPIWKTATYGSSTPHWSLYKSCRCLGVGSGTRGDEYDCIDEKDLDNDEKDDELEELLSSYRTLIPLGGHRVVIVQPALRGPGGYPASKLELLLQEAVALAQTLPEWHVLHCLAFPTRIPSSKRIFSPGNLKLLTDQIKSLRAVTAVFLNVERLSPLQETELETFWGLPVLDRYMVVLEIFRQHAHTREAKLQISLAEIPLLRSKLHKELSGMKRQGSASRYTRGSGETQTELRRRILEERKQRIEKKLLSLRKKRIVMRKQRQRLEIPLIAVVGYTNSGKTTLIKSLTKDKKLAPRDALFATLDVTVHGAQLPCRLPVLFMDTVGFLSQLPHGLVESFTATLQDITVADVILHVRDMSHPDRNDQCATVNQVLQQLGLPPALLHSVIEVQNKIDLLPGLPDRSIPGAVPVSALTGAGFEDLLQTLERAVLHATHRRHLMLRIALSGPQLQWLYQEAAVQEVSPLPDGESAEVTVLITSSALKQYKQRFGLPED